MMLRDPKEFYSLLRAVAFFLLAGAITTGWWIWILMR